MEVSGAEDGPVGLTGSARKAVDGLPRDSESFVSQDSGVTHLEGMQGAFLQLNGVRSLNGTESSTGGCLEPGVQEAGPDGERLSSHKASNSLPSGMIPATALRASKASTFPRGAYDSGSLPLHFGKSRHGAETLVTDPSSASRSSLSSLDSELSATLESTSCGAAGLGECDDNGELCTRPGSCGDLAGAMPWLEDIKELTLNNPEEGEPRELSMQEIEVGHGAEDKRKRSGFASFIARNWLALRGKDLRSAGSSTLGWKLFGKIPLKESPRKDPKKIQQEYEAKMGRGTSQAVLTLPVARRDNKFEPLSTTALILEQRPLSLPAKSEEEMQHHQELYNEMVARARKREVRDAQRQKRILKERCKKEESIIQAGSIWTMEILPNWEHSCGTRKVRELWWQGLPPSIRGKVWSLAIGNELNITPELYEIFLSRAKEKWRSYSESSLESQNGELGANGADRESSLELITLDISRTFPSLCIFQKGGPYHSTLQNVLGAYTCYRPDIGYVQGMSFLAAVLLLNLDVEEAFITFANLLNKPCQLVFFRVDHSLMLTYFETFELFFEENLPQLFRHFNSSNLTPDLYLIDWIFTLYSKALPLDVASRVWDVFCRDGEEFLFRTALGILRLYRDLLLGLDFVQGARFLTRLPDNVQNQELFAAIGDIGMQSKAGRWSQVFAALQKERKDCDRSGSP